MAINQITDHGGPDPIQGFDVDVWVQDQSSSGDDPTAGNLILAGSFTSIVVTIRNATEAYLELNQRIPRYLDGEVQIAWVMEKGLLDINVIKQTFGFSNMDRATRFNRSPRFTITFNVNDSNELNTTGIGTPYSSIMDKVSRMPEGRFILSHAKVDSWHFAATSGKQVVATQWQGVAEGIKTLGTAVKNIEGAQPASTAPEYRTR